MASKVRHNFKESALALLRGDWCNRVARRVSYWMGCNGVDVTMPDTPSGNDPIKVGLNVPTAAKILAGEMLSKNLLGLGGNSSPPFTLSPQFDENNHYTGLSVFLPSLTVGLMGIKWTVTGVTAITDSNGWYSLPSTVKSGTIGLKLEVVESGTTKTYRATFVASVPSNALFYKVGTVTTAGVVSQFQTVLTGDVTDNSGNSVDDNNPSLVSSAVNDGLPQGETLQTDTWYLGKGGTGVKLIVLSREKMDEDGLNHLFFWREGKFSNTGNLFELSAEKGCIQILA